MEKEVYALIPRAWHQEMRMFTENEFSSIVMVNGKIESKTSEDISREFNRDEYSPRDGELIKATDDLAAFIETYLALENGIKSNELKEGRNIIQTKYQQKVIAGIKFGEIYADFE
jgi:putative hydrolase of HD superfamily